MWNKLLCTTGNFIQKLEIYVQRVSLLLIYVLLCLNFCVVDGRRGVPNEEFAGRAERRVFGLLAKLRMFVRFTLGPLGRSFQSSIP